MSRYCPGIGFLTRDPRTLRRLAIGGIAGPVGFASAWIVGAARTPGYSIVDDAISRLAAVHADTRPLMTAGFVAFGVGAPAFAVALRDLLPGKAWIAAAAAGVTTLGVAAFPLDVSHRVDLLHGAWASLGYLSLAATPALAAGPLAEAGFARGAIASRLVSGAAAACLIATVAGPAHGLFQRLGISMVDAWIAVVAAWIVAGPHPTP